MTKAQIGKFFKLARVAHANAGPNQPFDGWRKSEMLQVLGTDSVFSVDSTWGFDQLMGHFAVLACDYSAAAYFATAAERRVRWVLDGLCKDLEFLQMKGVGAEYVEAIYKQAGMQPIDLQDATLPSLLNLVPMLDTRIRTLARENNLQPRDMPTAGAPWYFRGIKAARFNDYLKALPRAATRPAA